MGWGDLEHHIEPLGQGSDRACSVEGHVHTVEIFMILALDSRRWWFGVTVVVGTVLPQATLSRKDTDTN